MLIPTCWFPSNSFTGGSSGPSKKPRPPRARPFEIDEYGNMTDCAAIRDRTAEEARAQELEKKRKAATRKNRGKQPKINYRTMNLVDCSL